MLIRYISIYFFVFAVFLLWLAFSWPLGQTWGTKTICEPIIVLQVPYPLHHTHHTQPYVDMLSISEYWAFRVSFAHLELLSRVFPPKRCRQFLRHAFCSFSTYQTPEPSPINQAFKIWDRATATPPTALSPPLCFIYELNASEITSESSREGKMLQYFLGIVLFPLSALSEPNYPFKPVETFEWMEG